MTILPHPHASPLPSWASRPASLPIARQPSFTESLKAIWRWWRPRPVSLRERQLADAVVERIAAELEAETAAKFLAAEAPLAPRRPRRITDVRPIP